MPDSVFRHAVMKGIVTVVPGPVVCIDDEAAYFDGNPKKLARAKKIVGFGTRHVVPDGVTVVDLCEEAAEQLISEMNIDRSRIEALILVTQSPDHMMPASANILHGRLNLPKTCAALDIGLGCSGYVYGLWLAHSLIESRAASNVLLLAGDTPSRHSDRRNRLVNPVFGDAASATYLEYAAPETPAYFSLGADGKGWDKIVVPAGGARLPVREDICGREITDDGGNVWHFSDVILKGIDVFNFTLEAAPKNIRDVLNLAGTDVERTDYFVLHQANRQIVENVASLAGIPPEKTSAETFSKYANNSTTSVATVICDQLKDRPCGQVLLSAFGVGLSWGAAVLRFDTLYNGGVRISRKNDMPAREELISRWEKYFKGESE